jgi:hypothetical protein
MRIILLITYVIVNFDALRVRNVESIAEEQMKVRSRGRSDRQSIAGGKGGGA